MKHVALVRSLITPILAGMIFLVASGLLIEDRFIIGWIVRVPVDLARLGETIYAAGTVKRQSVFLQVWLDLGRRDTLYDGDRIFIGPGGSSRLRLLDLALIELRENTLIELSIENGIPKILAEAGEAEVTFLRDGLLLAQIGDATHLIDGKRATKVKLKRDEDTSGATLEIAEGKLKIDELEVADGDHVAIDGDGGVSKSSGQITALSPKYEDVTIAPSDRVAFSWRAPGGATLVEFKIETDEEQAKQVFRQTLKEQELNYTFAEPGHYVWSVRRPDAPGQPSLHNLQVRFNDRPLILEPRAGGVVDLGRRRIAAAVGRATTGEAGPATDLGVDLRWADASWAGDFQAQVAEDESFTKIAADVHLPAGPVAHLPVRAGKYLLRLRRRGDANIWSPTVNFTVEDRLAIGDARAPATVAATVFPYPASLATVLAHASARLEVRPRERCHSTCRLIVSRDGEPPRTAEIPEGGAPRLSLDVDPAREGTVRWSLEDDVLTQGEFFIRRYSKDNLERAIRDRSPTEVIN